MKRSVGRALVTAAFLAMGSVWSGTASASTVTYDFVLSPVPHTHTTASGTGVLTLNDPVSTSGWDLIVPHDHDVQSLTITIGSLTFDLTNTFGLIAFDDGILKGIFGYGRTSQDRDALLTVAFLGTVLTDGRHHPQVDFINSVVDPPASTPLPSTWSLMLIGFGALGFACYRARRNPALATA